ncbi:STAS domain-containing protein [bacterium]|nr:STAS domain-containing protein [bacterium]MBU1652029.1 STAS domain-containing protein [bacterium]MBU1882606.1 STAS domain-containing protein [bacterium]
MNGMTLDTKDVNGGTVISMGGRVMFEGDAHVFRQKLEELLAAGKEWFVLDLSGVIAMSSTGLGILIAAHRTVRDQGRSFKLAELSEKVRSILIITRLDSVFEVYDNADEAAEAAKEGQS